MLIPTTPPRAAELAQNATAPSATADKEQLRQELLRRIIKNEALRTTPLARRK